jgi:hypothetical protein
MNECVLVRECWRVIPQLFNCPVPTYWNVVARNLDVDLTANTLSYNVALANAFNLAYMYGY